MRSTRDLRIALRLLRGARRSIGKSRQQLPLGNEDTLRLLMQQQLLQVEADVRAAIVRARESAVEATGVTT